MFSLQPPRNQFQPLLLGGRENPLVEATVNSKGEKSKSFVPIKSRNSASDVAQRSKHLKFSLLPSFAIPVSPNLSHETCIFLHNFSLEGLWFQPIWPFCLDLQSPQGESKACCSCTGQYTWEGDNYCLTTCKLHAKNIVKRRFHILPQILKINFLQWKHIKF